MNEINNIIVAALALVMLAGCAWVKLEPGAEEVRVLEGGGTAGCERLGQITASVRDRVAAVQRRATKVEEELATLARNSALELGGDTIVPLGPVDDGQRSFAVYRCR